MPNDKCEITQEQLGRKIDALRPWLILTVFLCGILVGILICGILLGNAMSGGPGQ